MSEDQARELWTSLQACLMSQYRTLDWDKLPAMVQQDMARTASRFLRERDEKIREEVWAQVFQIYHEWKDTRLPAAWLGEELRKARLKITRS